MVTTGPIRPQFLAQRNYKATPISTYHGTCSPCPSTPNPYLRPSTKQPANGYQIHQRTGTRSHQKSTRPDQERRKPFHPLSRWRQGLVRRQKSYNHPSHSETSSEMLRPPLNHRGHITCQLSARPAPKIAHPPRFPCLSSHTLQRNSHTWS